MMAAMQKSCMLFQQLHTSEDNSTPTIFSQIDAHALHHQALGTQIDEINDFCIQKCMDLRSEFERIIMHQLHALLMLSALQLE